MKSEKIAEWKEGLIADGSGIIDTESFE